MMHREIWIGAILALLTIGASAQQAPVFDEGEQTLTLPVVDTAEQPGKYQNVVLMNMGDNQWRIVSGLQGVLIRRAYNVKGSLIQSGGAVYADFAGDFSGGCQELGLIRQRRTGNQIELTAYYADGAWLHELVSCTTALVPFRKVMPLDLTGLAAGSYDVSINGFSLGSFVLPISEYECSSGCEWLPGGMPYLLPGGQLLVPVVDSSNGTGSDEGYQNLVFEPTSDVNVLQLVRADIGKQVQVLSAEVSLLESFPVQARLKVTGYYGCFPPGRVEQRRFGNVFSIAVLSTPPDYWVPGEIDCSQRITSFTQTVPMDIYDLDAGEYQYRVNGVFYGSFQLTQDNRLP